MNLVTALAKRPHAGPVGAARRRLPGDLRRQPRRPLDRLLRRSEPDAPLRRLHQPAAAQLRRRSAFRRRVRGSSSRRSAPTAGSSPSSWRRQASTEPVRLLDPNTMQPTTKLDFPGRKPVWGVDVQFSADGRYLAATVHTVHLAGGHPPRPRATRWSGTSAPRPRPPSGCRPEPTSRAGAQPGRPDPLHGLAADGVRGGDGQADLAARGSHVAAVSRRERRGDPAGTRGPRVRTRSW